MKNWHIRFKILRVPREGKLLLRWLAIEVPEAIQLTVVATSGLKWCCYKRYAPLVFIPVPAKGFHGLFVEANVVDYGRIKRETYADYLEDMGYCYIPPDLWFKQIESIKKYLEGTERYDYERRKREYIDGEKSSLRRLPKWS